VPADRIIDTALQEKVDCIGLSGLITPSLEEMTHVAAEMQRRGLNLPLLIGGATTSEIHTAVKIAPAYLNPVVYVKDASKTGGVLSGLLDKTTREKYAAGVTEKYEKLRAEHGAAKKARNLITLEKARGNRMITDWAGYKPSVPLKHGLHVINKFELSEIEKYIDWTFFFFAWKLSGKYPAILKDPVKGEEARKLFEDAKKYLHEIKEKQLIISRGVVGIFPAASFGDDVNVYSPGDDKKLLTTLRFMRNQEAKEKDVPNLCLADYIAPEAGSFRDYIGAFTVTADMDEHKMLAYKNDDYANIMIRILSDRIAEAAAELIHEMMRKDYWGYAPSENLSADDLFRSAYRGIRPAPGYPACPDHTEKQNLFDLLEAQKNIGVTLTENYAMVPVSSVSAYVFAHPQAVYFNLGKIGEDQLKDYARRKDFTYQEAARWLSQNI
jgi:5-methyltetrahydrofolate--homocysteine methyltransferase